MPMRLLRFMNLPTKPISNSAPYGHSERFSSPLHRPRHQKLVCADCGVVARLFVYHQPLRRFYVVVGGVARCRLAYVVGVVYHIDYPAFDSRGEVDGVDVACGFGCLSVVISVCIEACEVRPARSSAGCRAAVVAYCGECGKDNAYAAVEPARCKRLSAALAAARNEQAFTVPLRLGGDYVDGALDAQEERAEEE